LIRWSDDGQSFLILDEEAFAKDIIPHFWKHSNYASFVRQLNMYGFNKMVGLNDNSMKASESKAKQPSRYKSPYFQRGRPDLLWLIQKPVKQTTTRKGQDVKPEEEANHYPPTASVSQNVPPSSNRKVEVDEDTLKAIQKELADLRKQNHMITTVLNALRKQDVNIQSQALQFATEQQRMQQRHQQQVTSLQAIVSFLYNIFNNRLDGESRATFDNMLRSLLPSNNSGVVEVPDIPTAIANMNFNLGGAGGGAQANRKRTPLMLPAPESNAAPSAR
jgi:heat shock transcription factor, other eukaryote